MSSSSAPISAPHQSTSTPSTQSYFETQRTALLGEIEMSLEHVLANINKLNRNLESLIALGNEFSSVEALWSQFENVMAKDPDAEGADTGQEGEGEGQVPHQIERKGDEGDDVVSEQGAGRR